MNEDFRNASEIADAVNFGLRGHLAQIFDPIAMDYTAVRLRAGPSNGIHVIIASPGILVDVSRKLFEVTFYHEHLIDYMTDEVKYKVRLTAYWIWRQLLEEPWA